MQQQTTMQTMLDEKDSNFKMIEYALCNLAVEGTQNIGSTLVTLYKLYYYNIDDDTGMHAAKALMHTKWLVEFKKTLHTPEIQNISQSLSLGLGFNMQVITPNKPLSQTVTFRVNY